MAQDACGGHTVEPLPPRRPAHERWRLPEPPQVANIPSLSTRQYAAKRQTRASLRRRLLRDAAKRVSGNADVSASPSATRRRRRRGRLLLASASPPALLAATPRLTLLPLCGHFRRACCLPLEACRESTNDGAMCRPLLGGIEWISW